jgi:xanthine dehydrogenase small subunit
MGASSVPCWLACNIRAMSSQYHITINSTRHTLDCQTHAPLETLLKTLHRLGLKGSKEGCGDGDCGACTVACVGPDGKLRAINSCLVPSAQLANQTVYTVEGIAAAVQKAAHPVQQAMMQCAGSQCGYCTPGFVMSLFTDYHNRALDDASVEGNLCRCTGYVSIRNAVAQLQETDHMALAMPQQAPQRTSLIANTKRLLQPETLAQALAFKAQDPEAQWLAGGTDLGLDFSRHRGAQSHICLDQLTELRTLRMGADMLEIGASTPLADLAEFLEKQGSELPAGLNALPQMLHWFAAKQVRNRATLGGNLGTASPIGDLLPVLLALDAQIDLASTRGTRSVSIDAFFQGYRQTARRDDELIVCVRIPLRQQRSASYKVGKRGSDDISIVAASFAMALDAEQRVQSVRMAYGGVAATPMRALAAETLLMGQCITPELLVQVHKCLQQSFSPLSDFRGSADYRSTLVSNLFEKFLLDCNLMSQTSACA